MMNQQFIDIYRCVSGLQHIIQPVIWRMSELRLDLRLDLACTHQFQSRMCHLRSFLILMKFHDFDEIKKKETERGREGEMYVLRTYVHVYTSYELCILCMYNCITDLAQQICDATNHILSHRNLTKLTPSQRLIHHTCLIHPEASHNVHSLVPRRGHGEDVGHHCH